MFTAILWDYDGTLANTPVKNIAFLFKAPIE